MWLEQYQDILEKCNMTGIWFSQMLLSWSGYMIWRLTFIHNFLCLTTFGAGKVSIWIKHFVRKLSCLRHMKPFLKTIIIIALKLYEINIVYIFYGRIVDFHCREMCHGMHLSNTWTYFIKTEKTRTHML